MAHAGDQASEARLPRFTLKWQRRFLWMGHYGHSLLKPTELVGVFPGLDAAWPTQRPARRDTSSAYSQRRDKQGRKRVAGKAGLKATEHYPAAFCDATARLIKNQLQLRTRPCSQPRFSASSHERANTKSHEMRLLGDRIGDACGGRTQARVRLQGEKTASAAPLQLPNSFARLLYHALVSQCCSFA